MQQHTRLTFCFWPWFSLQPRSLCLLIFAWLLLPSTLWLAQSARQGVGLGEEKQQTVNKLKSINLLAPHIDFSGFLPNLASYPSLGSSYEVLSHWWSWDVLIYKSKLWKEGIFWRVNFFSYIYTFQGQIIHLFFSFAQNITMVWKREADQRASYQLQNSGNENFLRSGHG